jgi:molecular chaperone HtpG
MDEFNGKKLKSLNKSDKNFDETEETKKVKKESKNLLETIKNNLEGKIDEVKVSNRLKKSAVCLVTDESGMSIHTEELLKKAQNIPFQSKKILEINPNHKIFDIMKKEYDENKNSELIKEYSKLLYNQAMIMEGMTVDNPTDFANNISKLMVKAKNEDKKGD